MALSAQMKWTVMTPDPGNHLTIRKQNSVELKLQLQLLVKNAVHTTRPVTETGSIDVEDPCHLPKLSKRGRDSC